MPVTNVERSANGHTRSAERRENADRRTQDRTANTDRRKDSAASLQGHGHKQEQESASVFSSSESSAREIPDSVFERHEIVSIESASNGKLKHDSPEAVERVEGSGTITTIESAADGQIIPVAQRPVEHHTEIETLDADIESIEEDLKGLSAQLDAKLAEQRRVDANNADGKKHSNANSENNANAENHADSERHAFTRRPASTTAVRVTSSDSSISQLRELIEDLTLQLKIDNEFINRYGNINGRSEIAGLEASLTT